MHRSVALVVLSLLLLGGVTAGAVAYDRAQRDRIAQGVRVAGIEVGGLTASEAQRRLERELLVPLREPIVVRYGERRWTLGPKEARIAADLDGAVAEAMDASRGGGLPGRVWRGITGGEVERDLDAGVSYSRDAVRRLVDRVRGALKRPAQDAVVELSGAGIQRVPAKKGREVIAKPLAAGIRQAIVAPGSRREFTARVRSVEPKVTTAELAERYGTVLIVNRSTFKLTLYKELKPVKTYGIAVGQAGLETPAGRYAIENKAVNPSWHVPNSDWAGELAGTVVPPGPSNPIKARWMGIYAGAGIHGTDAEGSIGTAASHGCIRMRISEVIELYDRVPVGTPVYIA